MANEYLWIDGRGAFTFSPVEWRSGGRTNGTATLCPDWAAPSTLPPPMSAATRRNHRSPTRESDFCNKIGTSQTSCDGSRLTGIERKADDW